MRGEKFKRDLPIKGGVFSQINFAHPARAKRRQDSIMSHHSTHQTSLSALFHPRRGDDRWNHLHGVCFIAVGPEQSFNLLAQASILCARRIEKSSALFGLNVQDGVK